MQFGRKIKYTHTHNQIGAIVFKWVPMERLCFYIHRNLKSETYKRSKRRRRRRKFNELQLTKPHVN